MYMDAVRLGDAGEAAEFAKSRLGDDHPWQIDWASRSDLDARLYLKVHSGPVTAMSWGIVGGSPLVAVSVSESLRVSDDSNERLQVWDLLSGRSSPSRSLGATSIVFATLADGPAIVTGHENGTLRLWTVPDLLPIRSVAASDRAIVQTVVVAPKGHPEVIALDMTGNILRWPLRGDARVERFESSRSNAIFGGRTSDGRMVLISAGNEISIWDVESGYRNISWPGRTLRNIVSVVLTTVDGRDLVTVLTELKEIVSFDFGTGQQVAPTILMHKNVIPNAAMRVWSPLGRRAQLASVSGTLAVPTSWRVHLWNSSTCLRDKPPLSGPLAKSLVQAVRWEDREFLLTGAAGDGVVALWDLDAPVAPSIGHGERVSGLAVTADPQTVVSVDEGGTIFVRQCDDGTPVFSPLETGTEGVGALAAWVDHRELVAATGAGSNRVPDGKLRLWRMATGAPELVIDTRAAVAYPFAVTFLGGENCLVTLGPRGELSVWRSTDGRRVSESRTEIRSRVSGMTAGVIGDRPVVGISAFDHPITMFFLDDATSAPVRVPGTHNDLVVEIVDTYIVTGAPGGDPIGWKTIRARDIYGERLGPDITSEVDIVAVAVASWPTAYIARTDGRVSLTDLETGSDLCEPMLLARRPGAVCATANGDLLVAFGSDVAMVRPPIGRETSNRRA
jgi:WD40 repeat protein